ncbi:Ionotropic receptor 159 [Diabrotica virgifera virgifera]|nr:Ionotropic receptor 159 [Diabrotica virgifera virgifera]
MKNKLHLYNVKMIIVCVVFLHKTYAVSSLIFAKQYDNDLELCCNDIVKSTVSSTDIVYLINTNVTISYPAIYINTNYSIRQFLYLEPTLYIISGNISEVVKNLFDKMILNSRAKFIFIMNEINKTHLGIFNKYFFLKILIILNRPGMHLFTCSSDKCLPTGDLCLQMRNTEDLFRKRNLKISKLDATWIDFAPFIVSPTEGIHVEVINMIASYLHLNINYVEAQSLINPLAAEPKFKENLYDFSLVPYVNETTQFDKTIPFTEDIPVYVTPRIIIDKKWQIFYREFDNRTWICFSVVIILFYLLFKFIHLIFPYKSNLSVFEIILGVLLGSIGGVNARTVSQKLLLTLFIFFSHLFTTIYRSKMFDMLKTDLSAQLITSRDDILNSNLKIGMPGEQFVGLLQLSQNPFELGLIANDRVINCFNFTACVDRVVFNKDIVTKRLIKAMHFLIPAIYLDSKGRSLIYIIKDPLGVPFHFGILFLKGHPLFEKFNKNILLLKEAGFISHLCKIYENKYERAMILAQHKQALKYSKLQLETLGSTFFMYLFGITASIIVFSIETFVC